MSNLAIPDGTFVIAAVVILQARTLAESGALTYPNQVRPSIEASADGTPSATVSPSEAPTADTDTVWQEFAVKSAKETEPVTEICSIMGVPLPIVTAPALET